MDSSYITPFIEAANNVFSTMLSVEVTCDSPHIKADHDPVAGITGSIGITGDVQGVVAIYFPEDTAQRVASLFVGETLEIDSANLTDAVGELVNMICGNAKAKFENRNASITCPSVFRGTVDLQVQNNHTPTIVIPCDTDCGPFAIEVTLRDSIGQQAA